MACTAGGVVVVVVVAVGVVVDVAFGVGSDDVVFDMPVVSVVDIAATARA